MKYRIQKDGHNKFWLEKQNLDHIWWRFEMDIFNCVYYNTFQVALDQLNKIIVRDKKDQEIETVYEVDSDNRSD